MLSKVLLIWTNSTLKLTWKRKMLELWRPTAEQYLKLSEGLDVAKNPPAFQCYASNIIAEKAIV